MNLLIENGSAKNTPENNSTGIQVAKQNNHIEIVKLQQNMVNTELYNEEYSGDIEKVKYLFIAGVELLFDRGADTHVKDKDKTGCKFYM